MKMRLVPEQVRPTEDWSPVESGANCRVVWLLLFFGSNGSVPVHGVELENRTRTSEDK